MLTARIPKMKGAKGWTSDLQAERLGVISAWDSSWEKKFVIQNANLGTGRPEPSKSNVGIRVRTKEYQVAKCSYPKAVIVSFRRRQSACTSIV